MTFLADESVDAPIVRRLRAEGHRVDYAAELAPGCLDSALLDLAVQNSALFMTADKDFGDLVFRQRRDMTGVVLIRLAGLSTITKADIVARAVREQGNRLVGAFSVITPWSVRIRRPSL